jgi:hypothetical protein
MSAFGLALRDRLHLSSSHRALHKTIYFLCLPSLFTAANAVTYYLVHGQANLAEPAKANAWTLATYSAPWLSLVANIAATVVFVMFSRHRRVRSHSRVAVSFMLTLAWLGTFVSFLVLD